MTICSELRRRGKDRRTYACGLRSRSSEAIQPRTDILGCVTVTADGALLVSEDDNDTIWRIAHKGDRP